MSAGRARTSVCSLQFEQPQPSQRAAPSAALSFSVFVPPRPAAASSGLLHDSRLARSGRASLPRTISFALSRGRASPAACRPSFKFDATRTCVAAISWPWENRSCSASATAQPGAGAAFPLFEWLKKLWSPVSSKRELELEAVVHDDSIVRQIVEAFGATDEMRARDPAEAARADRQAEVLVEMFQYLEDRICMSRTIKFATRVAKVESLNTYMLIFLYFCLVCVLFVLAFVPPEAIPAAVRAVFPGLAGWSALINRV